MNEIKLTPWFPGTVLPVRKGLYNVSCRNTRQSGYWWAYFNGTHFSNNWSMDRRRALRFYKEYKTDVGTNIPASWRGIAK